MALGYRMTELDLPPALRELGPPLDAAWPFDDSAAEHAVERRRAPRGLTAAGSRSPVPQAQGVASAAADPGPRLNQTLLAV